jgi:cob(I)alamin adenosyltransferase
MGKRSEESKIKPSRLSRCQPVRLGGSLAAMSIVTKTGDQGTTALMYNRRVSKHHPRVEAYGTVDELNAALGMARATTRDVFVRETLVAIQQDLIAVMGELATSVEDLPRYARDGYPVVGPELSAHLEQRVREIEAQNLTFSGWAMPGNSLASASLDLARTVCRRAERGVCALQETGQLKNPEIIIFLNRLSDLLWLLARWEDRAQASAHPQP